METTAQNNPRPFRNGSLTKETAPRIAQRIGELLAGKLFAVCSFSANLNVDDPRLELDQLLRADWTDGLMSLVRVGSLSGSILFSDNGHVYTYNALNPAKPTKFIFERDGFRIEDPLDDGIGGGFRKIVFKVQGDIPADADEYSLRELGVHLTLASRETELTDEMREALKGQIPRTYDVKEN